MFPQTYFISLRIYREYVSEMPELHGLVFYRGVGIQFKYFGKVYETGARKC